MRITANGSSFTRLKVCLALAAMCCVPMHSHADEGLKARNAAYLDQVVGLLRSNVLSMRMILEHDDLKYADNIVRHAEAFERAFGMIGPMDWHAAEAFNYAQKSKPDDQLSMSQFEVLAENSRLAISQIKRSARRYMRDKNKALMRNSITKMMTSCSACHSRMPEGTVPSVWKGMKE